MEKPGNVLFFDRTKITNKASDIDKVYHYTSPLGLYSMIKNNTIWFTDCQYLNDKSEFVYINSIFNEAINRKKDQDGDDSSDFILSPFYKSYDDIQTKQRQLSFSVSRYYLLCTSLKADNHGMWSYYVKSGNYAGYNVRINVKKLTGLLAEIPEVKILHGRVIYNREMQVKQVREKLDMLDAQYRKDTKAYKSIPQELSDEEIEDIISNNYQENISEFLRERCLFFKNDAFESEDEYRFIIKAPLKLNIQSFMLQHKVGSNGVIIPYREFRCDIRSIIDQITIAPMMEKEVAKEGLISFLNLSYENQFDIKNSKLELRF